MATRKKWKVAPMGGGPEDTFPSYRKTNEWIECLRSSWRAGTDVASVQDVWVDEGAGSGWELYERINFADED